MPSSPASSPSPTAGGWTGLRWSATAGLPDGAWINAILPWRGGYVAAGGIHKPTDASGEAAFFTSTDGLHWSVAYQIKQANPQQGYWTPCPDLVPLGSGLLAVGMNPCGGGAPTLWHSADGTAWTLISSQTWESAWATSDLIKVAGGPAGVVAIGVDQGNGPVIVHSTDGRAWNRLDLPAAFDHATLRDVLAYGGGFVIVGRDGQPDPSSGPPGVGKPAAWVSPDGVTWTAAQVEGTAVAGGELRQVVAGPGGLFAEGVDVPFEAGGRVPATGWVSTDGQTWRTIGQLGTAFASGTTLASDGSHMVMLGAQPPVTGTSPLPLAAWVSGDGVTWTRLEFSFEVAGTYLAGVSDPVAEGQITGVPLLSDAWVVGDGVVILASESVPPGQENAFAAAIGP